MNKIEALEYLIDKHDKGHHLSYTEQDMFKRDSNYLYKLISVINNTNEIFELKDVEKIWKGKS